MSKVLEPAVEMPYGFGVVPTHGHVRPLDASYSRGQIVEFDLGLSLSENLLLGSSRSGAFNCVAPTYLGVRTGRCHAVMLEDVGINQVGLACFKGECEVYHEGGNGGTKGKAFVVGIHIESGGSSGASGGGSGPSGGSSGGSSGGASPSGGSSGPSGGSSGGSSGAVGGGPKHKDLTIDSGEWVVQKPVDVEGGDSVIGKKIRGLIIGSRTDYLTVIWDGLVGFGQVYQS